jgi:hypothetical protein
MGKIYEVQLEKSDVQEAEKHRHTFRFFYHPKRKIWYVTERALEFAREKGIEPQILSEVEAKGASVDIIESFPASIRFPLPQNARDEIAACALAGEEGGHVPTPIFLGRNVDLERHPGAFVLDTAGGSRKYVWRFRRPDESIDDTEGGDEKYSWGFRKRSEHISNIPLEKRFARLSEILRDPHTKVVLSMGGGGVKSFAHAVIYKLIDALGGREHVDEVWASGAGGVGALWYASEVSSFEIEQGSLDLYHGKYELKLAPSLLRFFRDNVINQLIPPKLRSAGGSGLGDPAQSIIDFIAKVRKYRQLKIPLFCLAFNLNEFRSEVLTPENVDAKEYGGLLSHADAIDAVIASLSVPHLFPPRVVRHDHAESSYIDGMTIEPVPNVSVYRKWLIDRKLGIEKRPKLFILAARITESTKHRVDLDRGMSEADVLMANNLALRQSLHECQVELVRKDPHVQLLDVNTTLAEHDSFDISAIPKFIDKAYIDYIDGILEFEG